MQGAHSGSLAFLSQCLRYQLKHVPESLGTVLITQHQHLLLGAGRLMFSKPVGRILSQSHHLGVEILSLPGQWSKL